MDIYTPSEPREQDLLRPAILYIHGGGWAKGSRLTERDIFIAKTLAENGYVVFSIDYHLTQFKGEAFHSEITIPGWPQNIYDCKSAVRFIRKNAQKYHIADQSIAVMGCSAGGHLALLTALSATNPILNSGGLYREVPSHVSCVVSFYGIPDIRTWGGDAFMGVDRRQSPDQWSLASPVTYLTNNSPPILLVHGDKDQTVSLSLAIDFSNELKTHKISHALLVLKDVGHSFGLELPHPNLKKKLLSFLEQHL